MKTLKVEISRVAGASPANLVLAAFGVKAATFRPFRIVYRQALPITGSFLFTIGFRFGVGRYSTIALSRTSTSVWNFQPNNEHFRSLPLPQHLKFNRLLARGKHSEHSKKTGPKSGQKRKGRSGPRKATLGYNPAEQPRVTWYEVIQMEHLSERNRGEKNRDRGDRGRDRGERGDKGDRDRGSRGGLSDMHRFGERNDQQDFRFESERKLSSGAGTGGDSYRPGGGGGHDRDRDRRDRTHWGRDSRDRGRSGGGYNRGGRGGGDGGMRKPWVPIPAHSRPMMVYKREKTPEQLEGMVSSRIYTEAEEAESGESENDEDGDGSVQMELDYEGVEVDIETTSPVVPVENIKEGEQVVKAEKVKMDVITMIRKAKAKPAVAVAQKNAVADNDDFISFGFSDDGKETEKENGTEDRGVDEDHGRKTRRVNDERRLDTHFPPPGAGRDRGFSHRESLHQYLDDRKTVAPPPPPPPLGVDLGPPGASGATIIPSSLPPPPGLSTLPVGGKAPEAAVPGGITFALPPKPPPVAPLPITPNLGTWPPPPTASAADIISISSSPTPPPQKPSSSHEKKRKLDTNLTAHLTPSGLAPEYMLPRNSQKNPTPWLLHDHSRTLHPSDQLHKEIHDFITYIRPRRYEHAVRRHVIHRIRTAITNTIYDVDVRCFGSFAAEIYLPSSDIDLAVISRDFARTGVPKYSSKNTLYKVSNLLQRAKIPKDGQVAVISKAKVPIIKFVDAMTGLQVDICFENLSGVNANRTFKKWREEYPAMPALAMIVKQFLELRKQNEVYVGGLGGFTVICLVISLLQLHPGFSSGNIPIEKNLGIGLMEFLDLYGHRFKIHKVGIDVGTHSYFRKPYTPPPRLSADPKSKEYRDYWILHIVDPNDPDNNIARASYGVREIFGTFADGFRVLESRMKEIHGSDFDERKEPGRGSVLETILGGNYERVERQRAVMRRVYEEAFGEVARDDEAFGEEGQPWRWEWDSELTGDGGGKGFVVDIKGLSLNGKRKTEGKGKGREKWGRSGDVENDEGNTAEEEPNVPPLVLNPGLGKGNQNKKRKLKKKNKAATAFASNKGGGASLGNGGGSGVNKGKKKRNRGIA